jgi:hypothetical protein
MYPPYNPVNNPFGSTRGGTPSGGSAQSLQQSISQQPGVSSYLQSQGIDPSTATQLQYANAMYQTGNWNQSQLPQGTSLQNGQVVANQPNWLLQNPWVFPAAGIGGGAALSALAGGGGAAAGAGAATDTGTTAGTVLPSTPIGTGMMDMPGVLPSTQIGTGMSSTMAGLPSFSSAAAEAGSPGMGFLQQAASQLQNLKPSQTGTPGGASQQLANLGQMSPLSLPQISTPTGGGMSAPGAPPYQPPGGALGQLALPPGGMGSPGGTMAIAGPGNPTTTGAVQNAYLAALSGNPMGNPAVTGRSSGWWPLGYGG